LQGAGRKADRPCCVTGSANMRRARRSPCPLYDPYATTVHARPWGAAGEFRYTLQELAGRFGVTNVTASRYCLDIRSDRPPAPRSRRQAYDAEGHPITVEQVERAQAMRAERDDAGAHRYTREQVAEACGVSVATVKRLERRLTGPPRPGNQAAEVNDPSWPQPVQRGIAAPGTPRRPASTKRPMPQRPGSTLSP
jgi:transcriptional regulator with XRE-family HTH domain